MIPKSYKLYSHHQKNSLVKSFNSVQETVNFFLPMQKILTGLLPLYGIYQHWNTKRNISYSSFVDDLSKKDRVL